MRMKSVQTRILLSLAAFFAVCLVLASISHRTDAKHVDRAVEDMVRSNALLLDRALEMRGAVLANMVNDYSYWDDLVGSIRRNDTIWTRRNIDPGLTSNRVGAIWILRPDYSLMYETNIWPGAKVAELLTPASRRTELFRTNAFRHFFVRTDHGLFEIRTAPIQPTSDTLRTGPSMGYICGARLWDSTFLGGLAEMANARLALTGMEVSGLDLRSEPEYGMLRYCDTLYGWDGTATAVVQAEAESPLLQRVWRDNKPIWVLIAVTMVFLMLTAGLLHVWVSRPIRQIALALEQENAQASQSLEQDSSELGRIARLVSQFFEQKRNLLKEIGDRARAQEALLDLKKTHEALLDEQRLLLENTRDFIYRHDTHGVFHYLSPSVQTVTGYLPDEWFKHYTSVLTDDPINLKVVEHTEKALRDGIPSPPYQVEVYHKQGPRVRLEVSEQPYFEGGKVAGIVGVARDITARWQAEQERESLQQQLEKAQRMESLALLAGGVAHDLNNTLGPLVAYPDLILEKLPPDSAAVGHVKTVKRAATQAAAIIHDLLMLARRGRYEMEPTDLNEVADGYLSSPSCLDLCDRHPKVTLAVELAEEPLMVQGSASHLATVLMNLVVNAFDAMSTGGTLTICTRREMIGKPTGGRWPVPHGEYVVVSVRDTGVGISPEDIDKIFEPYYSKKKMGRSGTGLGLAVVYGIVKDHKGYYDIDSTPGKGTCFSLLFPASHEAAPSDGTAELASGTERVLVVDDDEEQRQMAALLLRSLGYQTDVASGGAAAVAHLRQAPVDLVVLDMIMPELDGRATYEELLRISPKLRAIIISGYSPTDQVYAMQGMGAGEFVRKPFTRDQLAKAVRAELDRNAVAPPAVGVR
jgi:PAS domain S-box-containing protein